MVELPGGSSNLLWEKLALSIAQQEPAVAQAIVALASLHRAIKRYPPSTAHEACAVAQIQHELALKHCNRAMSGLRALVSTCDTTSCAESILEVVLMLVLLLFSFETLHCNRDRAALHIRAALRILCHRIRHQSLEFVSSGFNSEPGKTMVLMRATPRSNLDILIQTFVRLSGDSTVGNKDECALPSCPVQNVVNQLFNSQMSPADL